MEENSFKAAPGNVYTAVYDFPKISLDQVGTRSSKTCSSSERTSFKLEVTEESQECKNYPGLENAVIGEKLKYFNLSEDRYLSVNQTLTKYDWSKSEESVLPIIYDGILNNSIVNRIFRFGEKGSGYRSKGKPQDFKALRDQHLKSGTLFEDPEFPATDSSLFFSQRPYRNYEWKRPRDICKNPQFFVEGFSRFDVQQGELGDCWVLAAIANLTLYQKLFLQIVPGDQDFGEKYAGIFHFRFWQYGNWVDVVIDDRLPTYRGQLAYLHSAEENEFWSALIEKAYAKLYGSYEALKGGSTAAAMEDFTGGIIEMYEMDACPPNLFEIMLTAHERASLMGCSVKYDPNITKEKTPEGLITGHAYSITQVQFVDIQKNTISTKTPLLRLRNPWGNETEWNGSWSDRSPEWQLLSEAEKKKLGLTFENDGEFWMSYRDFQQHFSRVEICNLHPDSLSDKKLRERNKKKWEMSVFEGEWVRGITAGGCINYLESYWRNPQFIITVTEVDEGDPDGNCTVIIGLMQKMRRVQWDTTGTDLLTIGFAIYHLPVPDKAPKPLDLDFFKYNASAAKSPSYINLREVSSRFKLPPGTYCIVPSTFEPHKEGEFLLRVFSVNRNTMEYASDSINSRMPREVDDDAALEHHPPPSSHNNSTPYSANSLSPQPSCLLNLGYPQLAFQRNLVNNKTNNAVNNKQFHFNLDKEHDHQIEYAQVDEKSSLNPSLYSNYSYRKPLKVTQAKGTPEEQEEKDIVYKAFHNLAGKDKEVDWKELKQILDHVMKADLTNDGFSKDACRSMIVMVDSDRSGKLGYQEFKKLWASLKNWKNVWTLYDTDRSGTFSGFELRDAMKSAGYLLNNRILHILMNRYGCKNGEIQFDDFMMCAIKVKTMIDVFQAKDSSETNTALFTLEEWLESTLNT